MCTPLPSIYSSSSTVGPKMGRRIMARPSSGSPPYVTPRYQSELLADLELKGRQGELAYRVRGVQEITGHGYEERRVDVLAPGVWVVWLDLNLVESVKGMTVKKTAIRYPLRVVSLAVDPEANPWGLALDGYATDGPRRLTEPERDEDARQEK